MIRARCYAVAAAIGVALLGCGSGEATTAPATTASEQTVPLCSAINSGDVPVPEDGNCRETPTCAEVDEGAELPADGMCLDATEP